MAFPSLPIDGQIAVVNNIAYTYNATLNAWFRRAPTSANIITTDTANIVANTTSTSTTTGALRVAGGVGIVGNVYAGNFFYANGSAVSGAGAVGYTGSAGVGSTGYTGSAGSAGSQGTAGYTGSAGDSGTTGYTGSASTVAGYTGSLGTAGTAGYTGSTGDAGTTGYTGSASTAAGYTGSAGSNGSAGYTGSAGTAGTIGYTGSTGGVSVVVDSYTGNGSGSNFTLSTSPLNINQTIVSVGGILQPRSAYSVSGTTLTFTSTPANGVGIEVTTFESAASGGGGSSSATYAKTYYWKGGLTENVGSVRHYVPVTTGTINTINAYLATAGLTQSTAVVKKNGQAINTITFNANTTANLQTGLSIAVSSSDYLTVDITQSSSATDLYINFVYQG